MANWFIDKVVDQNIILHPKGSVIYARLPGPDGYFSPWYRFDGWGFGSPARDTEEAITHLRTKYTGGIQKNSRRTIVGERTLSNTYTIALPRGSAFRNVLGRYMRDGTAICGVELAMTNECVDNECGQIMRWFQEITFSGFQETDDFIQIDGGTESIGATVNVTFPEIYQDFYLQARRIRAIAGPTALHAVAYCDDACASCNPECQNGIYGGVAETLEATADQFQSGVALDLTGIPADSIITGIYCAGDKRIITYTDDIALPTVGGVGVSEDRGVTWAYTNYAFGVFGVVVGGGYTFIFGDAGNIYRSADDVTFTQVAATVTTARFDAGAWDEVDERLYLVGVDTANYAAYYLEGNNLTDITASIVAGAGAFTSITVLGSRHLMVGTAAGVVYENRDVNIDIDDFRSLNPFTGGAGIVAILGNGFRQIVFDDAQGIYRRDLMNQWSFKAQPYAGVAPTGNYTAAAKCNGGNEIYAGANDYIAVTDTGEIVELTTCPYGVAVA
jgi:hypothetical protein